MKLEQELIESLERETPDAGFSSRVMARIRDEGRNPQAEPRAVWLRRAAALILVTGLAAGVHHRIGVQRQQELAHEQLQTALRITTSKLDIARRGVLEHPGVTPPDERTTR